MERFRVNPCVLDAIEGDQPWLWYAPVEFHDEDGRQYLVAQSEWDARTLGIAEVFLDSPSEARFRTENGSQVVAREVRPYDAVPLGLSRSPLPVDAIRAAVFDGADVSAVPDPPESRLGLDPEEVWWDEATQRQRATDVAEAVAYDIAGEQMGPHWRSNVPRGLLGWAPTKVPVRAKDLSWRNVRFVTPTVAEALWQGERLGFRREHVIARSLLADMWHEAASLREIEEIVWDYRFAVVLTTKEESARIDRVGKRVGGVERYLKSGIGHVYDRLERRDVPVVSLDPRPHRPDPVEDGDGDDAYGDDFAAS